jgi:hypothetical protein
MLHKKRFMSTATSRCLERLFAPPAYWFPEEKGQLSIIEPYSTLRDGVLIINKTYLITDGEPCRIICPERDVFIEAPILNTGKVTIIARNIHIKHIIITNSKPTLIAHDPGKLFVYPNVSYSKPEKVSRLTLQDKTIIQEYDEGIAKRVDTFFRTQARYIVPFQRRTIEREIIFRRTRICP